MLSDAETTDLVNGAVAADSYTIQHAAGLYRFIALWPVRDQDHEWKLELDLDYTDRHSFGNTDVHRSTANRFLGLLECGKLADEFLNTGGC
jgi:hypothetical protein